MNPYRKIGLLLALGFTVIALKFMPRGQRHHHHQQAVITQHEQYLVERHHEGHGQHVAAEVPQYVPSEDVSVGLREYPNRPQFEIPTFPGCKGDDYESRLDCTREKYVAFIRRHLRQPVGKKGRAIVVFTIDLAGQVEDAELYEDTDPYLAAETMRLIGIMQGADMRWTPGKVKGTPRALKMALAVIYGKRCQDCAEVDFELYALD